MNPLTLSKLNQKCKFWKFFSFFSTLFSIEVKLKRRQGILHVKYIVRFDMQFHQIFKRKCKGKNNSNKKRNDMVIRWINVVRNKTLVRGTVAFINLTNKKRTQSRKQTSYKIKPEKKESLIGLLQFMYEIEFSKVTKAITEALTTTIQSMQQKRNNLKQNKNANLQW